MITNFTEKSKNDDVKFVTILILGFLFVAWCCTPPVNKFLQMCFWGNNTQMFIAQLMHKDTTEYIFHRNNAIYLAKMYPKEKKHALKEMDKAIATIPTFEKEEKLKALYRERADINMYYGNYKQALSDYINSDSIEFNDYLKMAMLYKTVGNYKEALSYCNAILNTDSSAYAGFACLADLYESANHPEISLRVWDLAIDRKRNNARAYISRALIKKKLGDNEGYEKDINTAKQYSNGINMEDSLIEETMHPKILLLSAK